MSQPTLQPDYSYLNNFLGRIDKKSNQVGEFQLAKIRSIIKKMRKDDPIGAQLAEANVELYLSNLDKSINLLEDLLYKTNNSFISAWELMLSAYMEHGDLNKVLETLNRLHAEKLLHKKEFRKVYGHAISVYLLEDIIKMQNSSTYGSFGDIVLNHVERLRELDISIQVYRTLVSILYRIFFSTYSGVIQPELCFSESTLTVRANSTINNPEDLFEINNKLNDQIMLWYSNSNDVDQKQIEKISAYFRHKECEPKSMVV
ncbi:MULTISPECIES: hypothetical protein [unclassified Acinetobacter]|uniref:hypothetical protein n=1 Tax=unclassified Acinetobacter TaxID=196816 RepID=UPI002935301F|nr:MULTISPECIES: hypothetical protein [unclassified Acinetobacter]WOE32183.1 hypothetical protein QSG84_02920 [Acinetobacter sp. SAAs470]WOE37653.1 hypothetical protein QSG86_11965 [Acinetobacter sp. SAAs474]